MGATKRDVTEKTDKSDKRPTYGAYLVIGNGEASRWTPIGAAWPNADGRGLNVKLDAIPVDGSVALREPREEDEVVPEREDRPRAKERRDGPRMG